MHPTEQQLQSAAAPTLERIRRDRKKAPPQIRPLLDYLEAHLFDPDLDANHLKRACGVRDNTLPICFHNVLALPPYAYIEDCRMEVACRLLCKTDLKIWQVGQLLGYSALPVFSRAFDRWGGVRPSVFRRRFKLGNNGNGRKDLTLEPEAVPLVQLETLLKALRGGLEKHEADELSRQLAELYPDSFHPFQPYNNPSHASP